MNISNVSQSLRLREYYYMGVRHKGWLISSIIISTFIALIFAFSMPKIYRSEALLLIETERILNPLISGLAISPSVRARIKTLREELLSWQRLTLLVEKLGLAKGLKTPLQREHLIKNLRSRLEIKLAGSGIISVKCESESPKESQEIVKTMTDIIVDGNLTSVDLDANSAIRFIQEQLDAYQMKLEKSETELRDFREVYMSTLPIASQMNAQLVSLKMELNRLLVDNTENHPRVIQTRQLIVELEQQRNHFMESAQLEGMDIKPENYARMVSSVPYQEQQMRKLQRNYAVNDRIYQQLLQRLETAKRAKTLEKSDSGTKFRILEPARLPLEPIKPNKLLFVIGGLITGIALGFVIIYIL